VGKAIGHASYDGPHCLVDGPAVEIEDACKATHGFVYRQLKRTRVSKRGASFAGAAVHGTSPQIRRICAGNESHGQRKICRLEDSEILLEKRFPDLFLSELPGDAFLAASAQLICQFIVAEN